MNLESFVAWLAQTPWSIALHESLYMYSIIETTHVLGLMLFVGTIAMVDLRLLGVAFREVPVSEMTGRILPWTVAGFVLMVATGLLLFYAIPVRTYHSVWFRLKLILLLVSAVNIFVFHHRVRHGRIRWNEDGRAPAAARAAAAISLAAWGGVIVTGRFIAYNWFDCDHAPPDWIAAFASCPAEVY